MFHPMPAAWLAFVSALLAGAAAAQTRAAHVPPPPDALPYRSAFEGYRPFGQDKGIAWKEANDTVYRRGGWRAYAEAQHRAERAAPPRDIADPHAGHAMPMHKEQP